MIDEFRGRVVRRFVDLGSKSEREAVLLEGDDRDFVLRRMGCNPLVDPGLDQLVGKRITVRGVKHGSLIIMQDWTEQGD